MYMSNNIDQIMCSKAPGWSHITFDELSIVNQAIRFINAYN